MGTRSAHHGLADLSWRNVGRIALAQRSLRWPVRDTVILQRRAAKVCVRDAAEVCAEGAGHAHGMFRGRGR